MLQELGVEFEAVVVDPRIDEHRSEAHLARHPLGKLPVLEDGPVVMFESAAMCLYLAEKHAEMGLSPEPGTPQSATHLQWVSYAITEMEQPLQRIDLHRYLLPQEKRSPAEVELASEDFLRAAASLNQSLAGKRFLLGDRFSTADVIMGYSVVWGDWEGLLGNCPNLRAYLQRLKERPAFPEFLRTAPLEH